VNSRVLIVAAGLACMSIVPAEAVVRLPATSPIVEANWQSPETLPRRSRNHCAYDSFSGRGYCSDHCGLDYQFLLLLARIVWSLPRRVWLLRLERIAALSPMIRPDVHWKWIFGQCRSSVA
jgi:hypothetical protein